MKDVITTKTPVSEVALTSGSQTITLKLINAAFGFPTSIVSGYQNTKTEEAGFERGDGDCGALGIGNIGSFIQAGKARIMMNTGRFNPATTFAALENTAIPFSKLETEFPAKTERERLARPALLVLQAIGQEFNAPTKVSADKVLALRAAMKFAFANKTVQTELLAQGETIGYIPGDQAKLDFEAEYKALKHVASLLGS